MAICPQCQVSFLRPNDHRRGVLHRKCQRLRALLARDCLTFREIARRMGVSQERIRQIAQQLGAKTGHARRKDCTRAHSKLPTHLDRIVRQARRAGLEASPAFRKGNAVAVRTLNIEGQTVAVSHLWHHPRLGAYRIKPRPWGEARFVIFYADDLSHTLIIPVAEVSHTAVVMGRPRKKMGSRESRMLCYMDAWQLLRRKHPGRPEGRNI
jgi:Sigma-70, region 4